MYLDVPCGPGGGVGAPQRAGNAPDSPHATEAAAGPEHQTPGARACAPRTHLPPATTLATTCVRPESVNINCEA